MKYLILNIITLLSLNSNAQELALEIGGRQQSGESSLSQNTTPQSGFQAGISTLMPITDNLYLGTGMLYTQRPIALSENKKLNKIESNYLDIPVNLSLVLGDSIHVFVGTSLAMHLNSNIENGTLQKFDSEILPLQFGIIATVTRGVGVKFYYEKIDSLSVENREYRAVGVNFLLFF